LLVVHLGRQALAGDGGRRDRRPRGGHRVRGRDARGARPHGLLARRRRRLLLGRRIKEQEGLAAVRRAQLQARGSSPPMLVEIAIGDAYGAGFEYASERLVRERNDLSAYIQHPKHSLKPGSYTDDTQMSIAVALAIVSGERWTPALLARWFVTAF